MWFFFKATHFEGSALKWLVWILNNSKLINARKLFGGIISAESFERMIIIYWLVVSIFDLQRPAFQVETACSGSTKTAEPAQEVILMISL